MYRILLFFALLIGIAQLTAQVSFKNGNYLISNKKVRSTLSIGIADLNDDYKDDICLLEKGKNLILSYQKGVEEPFDWVESGAILENPAWALSLGDLDNDGISEIFACGIGTYGNIFKQADDGSYYFTQKLYGLTFPQNSNMVDIDNDGWLDVFVCDERAYNDLFINDGSGTMVYNDYIDFNTVPVSNNAGNYGSEWVDFDDDRDIDLFITKCKPGVESPDDPRRINLLFVNDGSNHYTEQGEQFGLKNGAQSWTGSFGDLDNDGDLDCYVSNHDTVHVIYKNIANDTFVDVTNTLVPELRSASIQAAIRDFDNNGYMDIYVTGNVDYMYWNFGGDVWTVEADPFDENEVFSFATGDLNDDGFLDVYASYGELNETGDFDDVLWLNETNDNHYLKMSFLGTESNRKGVGTKVKAYSALGVQVRDVKIGESYGMTNSGNVHFGLGSVELIDSIHIFWPSGVLDKYYNVEVDQQILVQESSCLSSFFDIRTDGSAILCDGDSVKLSSPVDLESYEWSGGQTGSEIVIKEDADVKLRGIDAAGCSYFSNILHVDYNPDETPEISFLTGAEVNCRNDEVKLISSPAISYLWSTGETTDQIEIHVGGSYYLTTNGHCTSFTSDTINIYYFDVIPPSIEEDTLVIEEEQTLQLVASGDSIFWFDDMESGQAISQGPVFETGIIDRDTVFYAANYKEHIASPEFVGMEHHQGSKLGSENLNSGIIFNCSRDLILEQVKVYTDISGVRLIELMQIDEEDGTEFLLQSKEVQIDSGVHYIDLGFEIGKGLKYVLTTDNESNLIHFGHKSPGLYRSNAGVHFPYAIDELIELRRTMHGNSYFYYFYDWRVRPKSISCFSDRIALYIQFDTTSTTQSVQIEEQTVQIYPNPAFSYIKIQFDEKYNFVRIPVQIFNLYGTKVVDTILDGNSEIDVGHLPSGMYFIKLLNRVVKINLE